MAKWLFLFKNIYNGYKRQGLYTKNSRRCQRNPRYQFKIGKEVLFLSQGCPGELKANWFNCDRLLFKTGSVELNSASLDQIGDIAALMKAFPDSKFKIGGYTDNTGDVAFNKKLSGDRAAQVLQAIVRNGVSASSLSSEGYGPEHPVCPDNDSEECKAKNRRVAIRIEKCK